MGIAVPKIFTDPKPAKAANDDVYGHAESDVAGAQAANDSHYDSHGRRKKKSKTGKFLKGALKMAFSLAVAGAIGFTTGVIMDLYLIDSVHYPNEAMATIKNMMLHYGGGFLETLGISGDGGFLNWLFNQESVANVVAPFAPVSAATTVANVGTGVTAAQAAAVVATEAASETILPPAIDPLMDMMESNGL